MRKLTVNTMVWSATMIAAGVELNFTVTGDVLRKGKPKLTLSRAPLDDCLYPDASLDVAHLLDHAPEAEVACTAVFIIDTGDRAWKNTRDRGLLRENGWASRY
jgi:hypothetical protein